MSIICKKTKNLYSNLFNLFFSIPDQDMDEHLAVKNWLAALELPQYTNAFIENEFTDMKENSKLTDGDLKDLGIKQKKHRTLILAYFQRPQIEYDPIHFRGQKMANNSKSKRNGPGRKMPSYSIPPVIEENETPRYTVKLHEAESRDYVNVAPMRTGVVYSEYRGSGLSVFLDGKNMAATYQGHQDESAYYSHAATVNDTVVGDDDDEEETASGDPDYINISAYDLHLAQKASAVHMAKKASAQRSRRLSEPVPSTTYDHNENEYVNSSVISLANQALYENLPEESEYVNTTSPVEHRRRRYSEPTRRAPHVQGEKRKRKKKTLFQKLFG